MRAVEEGDEDATTELWEFCYPRLLNYSRQKLPSRLRRVLDEEDVALSAFKSFCRGAQMGALGDVKGRDSLWKLLFCIASRKARSYIRQQNAAKRGGGNVSGESAFETLGKTSGIENVASPSDGPDALAIFSADCQRLFDSLEDDVLEMIALLRIEGYSCDEIAQRADMSKRSVERRLNLIRQIWMSEGAMDEPSV
ncbi:ECF-type sigma factor [Rhodopirellula bahusiensis]|uniref:RNA polymerase subunit sigma-70 n=1 Tax=Rhodopirellula bahusiensis TaxID=2014065 RepID=A0A2G1W9Y6_9BACT|nr:ECF-type sigma factor [Rhodopirellula bahusiensis]PHQ35852.1 RNA polymerase subunit sigma-70 [Rhodopirellula bahusiensis]